MTTVTDLRTRVSTTRTDLAVVLLMCRGFLSLAMQGITAAILAGNGVASPWMAAASWWTVYGTGTDIACLALLAFALRREGRRLRDLIPGAGREVAHQLARAPLYLAALIPFILASSLLTGVFYGDDVPPQVAALHLPAPALAYSLLVWPVIWAITEEVLYLGYLLPRIEGKTGTPLAAALVVGAWALQHLAIPFLPDTTYLVSRLLAASLIVGGSTITFLLLKRQIVAAIAVHWLADASTVALAISLSAN